VHILGALLPVLATPAIADSVPPGEHDPTPAVALPQRPGTPVAIDCAHIGDDPPNGFLATKNGYEFPCLYGRGGLRVRGFRRVQPRG